MTLEPDLDLLTVKIKTSSSASVSIFKDHFT